MVPHIGNVRVLQRWIRNVLLLIAALALPSLLASWFCNGSKHWGVRDQVSDTRAMATPLAATSLNDLSDATGNP